ncbi:hypothetical protein DIPPA_31388 [Diplonema papillatum]|nr:hypothetical protein DIPPA_31388 [Diplonema papillatum]
MNEPLVAEMSDTGYVIAWTEGTNVVRAMVFNATGGAAFALPVTINAGDPSDVLSEACVAGLDDGGFAVVYQATSGSSVSVQRVIFDGTTGGVVHSSATLTATDASVVTNPRCANTAGGFIVQVQENNQIYATFISNNGIGSAWQLLTGKQTSAHAVTAPVASQFATVFIETGEREPFYTVRETQGGNVVVPEAAAHPGAKFPAGAYTVDEQFRVVWKIPSGLVAGPMDGPVRVVRDEHAEYPSIACHQNDDACLFVFQTSAGGGQKKVSGMFNSTALGLTSVFDIATGSARPRPIALTLANEDMVIIYDDSTAGRCNLRLFFVSPVASPSVDPTSMKTLYSNPSATCTGHSASLTDEGGFVVSWVEDRQRIVVRTFGNNASFSGLEVEVLSSKAESLNSTCIVGLDNGGFAVAYEAADNDRRSKGWTTGNIFVQVFDSFGVLESAEQSIGVETIQFKTVGPDTRSSCGQVAGGFIVMTEVIIQKYTNDIYYMEYDNFGIPARSIFESAAVLDATLDALTFDNSPSASAASGCSKSRGQSILCLEPGAGSSLGTFGSASNTCLHIGALMAYPTLHSRNRCVIGQTGVASQSSHGRTLCLSSAARSSQSLRYRLWRSSWCPVLSWRISRSARLVRRTVEQVLDGLPEPELVVWTDGSVAALKTRQAQHELLHGTTTPLDKVTRWGGAGFVIYDTRRGGNWRDQTLLRTRSSRQAGKWATSYRAEQVALRAALKQVEAKAFHRTKRTQANTWFLTDSSSLLTELRRGPHKQKEPANIEIWQLLEKLVAKGHTPILQFVFGHCALAGNDEADALAKNGISAAHAEKQPPMTVATARARYREHTWESVHASAMKASPYRPGGPLPYAQLVRGRKVPKTAHLTRRAEREIRQLRTGHHELLHNRYRKDWEDLAAEERQRVRPCELCDATPVCPITHLFLECKVGYAMRAPMWRQVFEADPKVPRELPAPGSRHKMLWPLLFEHPEAALAYLQDAGLVARYQILEDPPDPQTPAFHETPTAGGPNFADALDLDATSSATSSNDWA